MYVSSRHLSLLNECPVKPQHNQAARRLQVGTREGLHGQRRQGL